MKSVKQISPSLARRLAISRQRLSDVNPPAGPEDITGVLRDLGCIQIDPIRAVERTQLLVLWSRLGQYDPTDLDKLLWHDRRLFEYWAHAASIVLTEDYPLYARHMRDWASGDRAWMRRVRAWMAANENLRGHILAELRANGPLAARELEDHSVTEWVSGGWTSGRNVSQMLSYLWSQGDVMVSGRRGLTRLWDLTERCLPEWTPRQELDWPGVVYSAAQRSLRALGVARQAHIERHFTRGKYPGVVDVMERLEADGRIDRVEIADNGSPWPGTWFIHNDDLELVEQLENGNWRPRTTLLSPFDNLICDRDRTLELFGFHFRIEIYVPRTKRQYGYYVLPIMHDDRLIGRIDPKMDRESGQLFINAVYAEPSAFETHEVGLAIARSIEELAAFLGARNIIYCGEVPRGWRRALR